jgi:type VI secretion system protein ImpE
MTPKELLDVGRLDEAIRELVSQVKARPADTSLRVFLFELLCFAGEFDRAVKQLDVIAGQGGAAVGTELAVGVYRELIAAEGVRRQVFHGDALPKFLLSPPAYIDRYVMLVKALARAPKDAVAMLPEAEEQFPAIAGRVGGRAFSSLRDADDRVGPVLEAFHGATYLWLPLEQIRRIEVTAPKSLRDLAWAHARVETYEESVGDLFIPALYVDTARHADAQVRLGRMTQWEAVQDELVYGAGRRVFLIDDEEVSVFELADVEIDPPAAAAGTT